MSHVAYIYFHTCMHYRRSRLVRLCPLVAWKSHLAQQTSADPLCLWNHVKCKAGVCSGPPLRHDWAARQAPLPNESELCSNDVLRGGRDLPGTEHQAPGGALLHTIPHWQGGLCSAHWLDQERKEGGLWFSALMPLWSKALSLNKLYTLEYHTSILLDELKPKWTSSPMLSFEGFNSLLTQKWSGYEVKG